MQFIGYYILEYLETWDDDMINESDKQAWKVAKVCPSKCVCRLVH